MSAASELNQLASLHSAGHLSVEEFQTAKKQVLSKEPSHQTIAESLLTTLGSLTKTLDAMRVSDEPPSQITRLPAEVNAPLNSTAEPQQDACTSQGKADAVLNEDDVCQPSMENLRGKVRPGSLLLPAMMDFEHFSQAMLGDMVRLEAKLSSEGCSRYYNVHAKMLEQLPYFCAKGSRWRSEDVVKVALPPAVDFLDLEALLYRCYYGRYPQFASQAFGHIMAALSLAEYFLAEDFQSELQQQLFNVSASTSDDDVNQVVSEPFVTTSHAASNAVHALVRYRTGEPTSEIVSTLVQQVVSAGGERSKHALSSFKSVLSDRASQGWGCSDAKLVAAALSIHMWQPVCEVVFGNKVRGSWLEDKQMVHGIADAAIDVLDIIKAHIKDADAFAALEHVAGAICSKDIKNSMRRVRVVCNDTGSFGVIWCGSKKNSNVVCNVLEDSLAAKYNVRVQDRLIAVNGKTVTPLSCLVEGVDHKRVLDVKLQEDLLPPHRPLLATFVRRDYEEKRLAIQHQILSVGLNLAQAGLLPLDKLPGSMFDEPLQDTFLAEKLQSMEVACAREFASFLLRGRHAGPLTLKVVHELIG